MEHFPVLRYLHILAAFLYVAALFAGQWNMVAIRRSASWPERTALALANRRIGLMFGFGALLVLGVLGNLLGMSLGYRMATTPSFRIVNGLWLASVVVAAVLDLPLGARLAARAKAAAANGGGEPVEWPVLVSRWRLGNTLQLVLFLALLYFMVTPWKH